MSYTISLFWIANDLSFNQITKLMSHQFASCVKGILSFQNLDSCAFTGDAKDQIRNLTMPLNILDMIYLNNFRVQIAIQRASSKENAYKVHRYIYFPNISFYMQQISQPFKLVSTPLTNILAKKYKKPPNSSEKKKKRGLKVGFLTLDQNQRILPFMASDPLAQQVPLIGIWTYGLKQQANESIDYRYAIWSILVEFTKNKQIFQRFSYDDIKKRFLLVMFNQDETPNFYEIEIIDSEEDKMVDYEQQWLLLANSNHATLDQMNNYIFETIYNPNLCIRQIDNDDQLLSSGSKRCNASHGDAHTQQQQTPAPQSQITPNKQQQGTSKTSEMPAAYEPVQQQSTPHQGST